MTTTTPEADEALVAFLRALEQQEDARVIVRWTDEQRIQPNEAGGFTVGRVVRATLTARLSGQVAQHQVEGWSLRALQELLRGYDVEPIYRADNITR